MNSESKKGPLTPAEKIRAAGMGDNTDDLENEHEIWSGMYSGKAMLGNWIAAAAGSIVLLIGTLLLIPTVGGFVIAISILAVLLVLIWGGLGVIYLYRKWSRGYEVTTQRLKHRNGIFTRISDRIELIDIDDVTVRQGPIQAMMGVGNIKIKSSDSSHPELELVGIDQCRQVADLIDDARRKERRKRGLHIEAI